MNIRNTAEPHKHYVFVALSVSVAVKKSVLPPILFIFYGVMWKIVNNIIPL